LETTSGIYHGGCRQELLVCNEYLVTENRILRNQITGRVRLTDGERTPLAALGQKLGKQAGAVRCRERLGGLLKYYECEAA
jgi:hypothetical protein